MAYATYSDLQARLPGVTFTASTKPSTTQITTWIAEAEAMLDAALAAAKITAPVTNANGIKVCASLVLDYTEGRTRIALDSSHSDDANAIGPQMVKDFKDLILGLSTGEQSASFLSAMLGGGTAEDSTRRVRGHVLDNDDDESIADGDFDPTFTRDEVW